MALSSQPRVVIVGATGAVGQELIRLLQERWHRPPEDLVLLGSRSRTVELAGRQLLVQSAAEFDFTTAGLAFFSAGASVSAALAPKAVSQGCVVIDNTSQFRYEPDVPLVIPPINAAAIGNARLIANPNCTTAIILMALAPLHRAFGLKRLIAATYQAASGAGQQAMDELRAQAREAADGVPLTHHRFPHPLLFNLIPRVDRVLGDGYTKEECKLAWETRKILLGQLLDDPSVPIEGTCVRVPTLRCHAASVHLETLRSVDLAQAKSLLATAPGLTLLDDPANDVYPTPLGFSGKNDVGVGRVRVSRAFGDHGLTFWVCGDQLLRGAALNAVEIAECLFPGTRP